MNYALRNPEVMSSNLIGSIYFRHFVLLELVLFNALNRDVEKFRHKNCKNLLERKGGWGIKNDTK